MPSNQTTNYGLSQWVKSDQVKMDDFNADNAKIDGALKAEADARTILAAQVAAKGNCQVVWGSYKGTNKTGQAHPNTLTFDKMPLLVVIIPGGTRTQTHRAIMVRGAESMFTYENANGRANVVKWEDRSVSWYFSGDEAGVQLNAGATYYYVALLAASE